MNTPWADPIGNIEAPTPRRGLVLDPIGKVPPGLVRSDLIDVVAGDLFPPSPFNGQVIAYYADKTNFPDALWNMRFNAVTSRWQWLGGSPLGQTDTSGTSRQNSVDSTWANIGGLNSVTIARAGSYVVEFGVAQFCTTNINDDILIGLSVNGAAPSHPIPRRIATAGTGAQDVVPGGAEIATIAVTAGQTLAVQMKSVPHSDIFTVAPFLYIRPLYFT